jgi:SpoVK/Ycf46/Vps4 family AAA+-type ATPase
LQIAAKENRCFFLRISADMVRHREYGHTEKTVAAIFSLATKLWHLQRGQPRRPTIIFMDEVDTILGGTETGHEAYLAARSIFAQKWDGIQQVPGAIVLGTTNYPASLPGFIYRRFISRVHVR